MSGKKDGHELRPEQKLEKIVAIIYATPAQCLAQIKAQAFKQGLEACIDAAIDLGFVDNCAETCNQLRQAAKGE